MGINGGRVDVGAAACTEVSGGGWTIAVVDGGASWVVGAGAVTVTIVCAIPHAVVPKVAGVWDEAAVVGGEDLGTEAVARAGGCVTVTVWLSDVVVVGLVLAERRLGWPARGKRKAYGVSEKYLARCITFTSSGSDMWSKLADKTG